MRPEAAHATRAGAGPPGTARGAGGDGGGCGWKEPAARAGAGVDFFNYY
jgi:hypothetical protein